MKRVICHFILQLAAVIFCGISLAQNNVKAPAKNDISSLPGKGLAQHDFLYTGEWDYRRPVQTIYVIHKGKLAWTYEVPTKDTAGVETELGDATARKNGNIVFCRKNGATEVTPGKKIIWNYDAPKGTEIHAVEAIGDNNILMILNGVPARAMLINAKSGKIKNECILPTVNQAPFAISPRGNDRARHLPGRSFRLQCNL